MNVTQSDWQDTSLLVIIVRLVIIYTVKCSYFAEEVTIVQCPNLMLTNSLVQTHSRVQRLMLDIYHHFLVPQGGLFIVKLQVMLSLGSAQQGYSLRSSMVQTHVEVAATVISTEIAFIASPVLICNFFDIIENTYFKCFIEMYRYTDTISKN